MMPPVQVLTLPDFQTKEPDIYRMDPVRKVITQPQVCKAGRYQDVVYGTFVIPEKKDSLISHNVFSFCLTKNALYFIDEGSKIRDKIKKIEERDDGAPRTPMGFLLELMEYLIHEDLYQLENYEQYLTAMENGLDQGSFKNAGCTLSGMRQELNALSSYYMQLCDMGETLEEVILQVGTEADRALISLYICRVRQLYNMTRYVKESLSQVLSLKQEKISEKQNQLINVLTIVTSIFTPLSFITGWFGMNFEHMTILHEPWGYMGCIIFCLLLVSVEVILICRLKIFRK